MRGKTWNGLAFAAMVALLAVVATDGAAQTAGRGIVIAEIQRRLAALGYVLFACARPLSLLFISSGPTTDPSSPAAMRFSSRRR